MTTAAAPEGLAPPVELPVYSGPLDLLLHLIRLHKVSIYDIPITLVCDQYHAHLEAMQELDLDVAGEYLWMASWLLQLKSQTLLPRHREDEEDPRQELVERLLEYRRVKELAGLLYDTHVVRRCMWSSAIEAGSGEEAAPEIDWENVDLRLLAQTYLDVMERFAASRPTQIQILPLRFSVQQKMQEIHDRVHADGVLPLLRHLQGRSDSEEVVVLFVASLELVRLGAVCAEQGRPFAEIYLRPGARPMAAERLAEHEVAGGV